MVDGGVNDGDIHRLTRSVVRVWYDSRGYAICMMASM